MIRDASGMFWMLWWHGVVSLRLAAYVGTVAFLAGLWLGWVT
jgi:hypothetical protein